MDIFNEELGPMGPIGFLPESHPLFCAVLENNIQKFKNLVESGHSVNLRNHRGSLLLNVVLEHKRTEIFDYLMGFGGTDINCVDVVGRSALSYAALEAPDDYFPLELIKRGADVNMADKSGASVLLRAASRIDGVDNLAVGRLIIEKGADVNARTNNGVNPLFAACEAGNFDWVCMLLYYGADASVIPEDSVLPLVKLSHYLPESQLTHLQEVLFDYTFDGGKMNVRLADLIGAMLYETPVFSKILEITEEVIYEMSDLEHLYSELFSLKPNHLRVFIEKFENIVKEMMENFPPLNVLRHIRYPIINFGFGYPNHEIVKMKEIFDIILDSSLVSVFVQAADPTHPTIFRLIDIFRRNRIFGDNEEEEEVTKMICVMLSHGLTPMAADLHAVYSYYGHCELFKILLHMDIDVTHPVTHGCPVPRLCFEPTKNIEDFSEIHPSVCILNYYNHPRLKKLRFSGANSEEFNTKLKNLPQVPLLVELSRNTARKYIGEKYKTRNSRQFYTVLKWLPIGDMNKRIIALEKQLY